MSQTPEERVVYWKKRINDRIKGIYDVVIAHMKDVKETIAHADLDDTEVQKALRMIEIGFAELSRAVLLAKTNAEVRAQGEKDNTKPTVKTEEGP